MYDPVSCLCILILYPPWYWFTQAMFSSVMPAVGCLLVSSSLRYVVPALSSENCNRWCSSILKWMFQIFERLDLISATCDVIQNHCTEVLAFKLHDTWWAAPVWCVWVSNAHDTVTGELSVGTSLTLWSCMVKSCFQVSQLKWFSSVSQSYSNYSHWLKWHVLIYVAKDSVPLMEHK